MGKKLILHCPECQSEIHTPSSYSKYVDCPSCNKKWAICLNCRILYQKISKGKYCDACQDLAFRKVKIFKTFIFLLYIYANFLMIKNNLQRSLIFFINIAGLLAYFLIDRKALAERKSIVEFIYGIIGKEQTHELQESLEDSQQFKVEVTDIAFTGPIGQAMMGKFTCPRCGTQHLIILGKSDNPPGRTCTECKTRLIIEYPDLKYPVPA